MGAEKTWSQPDMVTHQCDSRCAIVIYTTLQALHSKSRFPGREFVAYARARKRRDMRSSKPHFHIFRVAAVMITVALALPGSDAQTITTIASTISSNGDLNPYGVAQVPATSGALIKGDILVSNFNNSSNLQGRGTTIVQISPSGTVSLFA